MYKNIADYGLIGDMHSVALVSNDGSIDYCTMPHIDSATVFAALLDDENGGFFSIKPQKNFQSEQQYIKDTNILNCIFKTEKSKAELIDFMPISQKELFDKDDHGVHRCLKVTSGIMDFKLECFPRPNYALTRPTIARDGNTFKIKAGKEVFNLKIKVKNYRVIESVNGIVIHFSLSKGDFAHFDFAYSDKVSGKIEECSIDETKNFWIDWLHNCIAGKCSFLGQYADMVNRSLLVLKLLTFQPTGAIAAAATTSLPEAIGEARNWDYRFSWIRDASFTLKALFNLGHIREADGFIRWLHSAYKKYGSRNLQIMYSLDADSNLSERKLLHLKGYKHSKPVRIGNDAYKQNQWDVYGEIMDAALRLSDYAGKIDEDMWPFFKDICNLAIANWHRPDDGIWEVRNGPFHFVYSKMMCWVALDRGIKIAKRYGFDAPINQWQKESDKIKEEILSKGFDKTLNSFVRRYDSKELDASLLLFGLMDFLSFDDERIKGTIDACKKNLLKDGFLLRYSADDGLEGDEGGFILCNFWLIESMVALGQTEEAKELLSKTLKAANHLGLFSEEYDSRSNQMLGNFPQAFSHIGLINSVSAILNAQYKISQDQMHIDWLKRIEKVIPYKIVLNKSSDNFKSEDDIASQLKVSLNNLQGAFFDTAQGRVNYAAMMKSDSYERYIELVKKLNAFDPLSLSSDNGKKAFWINIYNILIIHGVIELGVQNSVREVFNFFGRIGYNIGGLFFSPDDIEHGILRANRVHPLSHLKQFSFFDKRRKLCVKQMDPRIHFALVCASSSCPPIEFYDRERINRQLNTAAKSFANRGGVVFNKSKNELSLSQIFKWYAVDFGSTKDNIINYAAGLMDKIKGDYIFTNLDKINIKYLPYNWNLNRSLK